MVATARILVWILALAPLGVLGAEAATGRLGANPIEETIHRTGLWGLILLLVSLAVTPLRRLTGWHRVVRLRRLLGLFAFFWICLHLLSYVVLDQWFAWDFIAEDIAKRPFILAGFAAWCLLLVLALTSTRGSIRRLGRRWTTIHSLVFPAAGLGVIHFLWKVKADTRVPLVFAAILLVLLTFRLPGLRGLRLRRREKRDVVRRGSPVPEGEG
jgi:sulfoxide reductase heme-binding subunit YedZ